MLDPIAHRGPDGRGSHVECGAFGADLALGHLRLAVIDLQTGDQPMWDPAGECVTVFNGEIYNFQELRAELQAAGHRFRTRSDTEVLLHGWRAWGEALPARLRGMFAFALWDRWEGCLFLARDHFGKKPLYLARAGEALLFGSEVKALLPALPKRPGIDLDAVWTYLRYRYVPGPATLYQGIAKLPPGHWLRWHAGSATTRRFFRPADGEPRASGTSDGGAEAMVDGFVDRLEQAVRRRMIADVPYGAFLSGGLDSSAVVALMSRQQSRPVRTFSIGFADSALSELTHAAVIARQFGTDHSELVVEPADLMALLPEMVAMRDAPVAEPSDLPINLLSRQAVRSVKMVLTGEGADEVLAGYPKHVAEPWIAAYQAGIPPALHRVLVAPLAAALPYRFRRFKTAMAAMGLPDQRQRYPRWFGALDASGRGRLCEIGEGLAEVGADLPFEAGRGCSALRRILFFDQTSWLPDNLLERGDRMTMAASLEARMPFMDVDLAHYCAALPDRYRLRRLTTKWVLRQAMARMLPAQILARPKIGFRVPVSDWFRGPMRDYLSDHLLGSDSRTAAYYRRPELEAAVRDHVDGRHNNEKLLWSLLSLELFHRHAAAPAP